jgi:hypothetical protein
MHTLTEEQGHPFSFRAANHILFASKSVSVDKVRCKNEEGCLFFKNIHLELLLHAFIRAKYIPFDATVSHDYEEKVFIVLVLIHLCRFTLRSFSISCFSNFLWISVHFLKCVTRVSWQVDYKWKPTSISTVALNVICKLTSLCPLCLRRCCTSY